MDSYMSAAPFFAVLDRNEQDAMCRRVVRAQMPPPRTPAWHCSKRTCSRAASETLSATPPPAAVDVAV
eukprot:570337-Prymnesium_polylepis.2